MGIMEIMKDVTCIKKSTATIGDITYIGGITHDGKFTADTVLSTALIQIVWRDFMPRRMNDFNEATNLIKNNYLVYGIGDSEFTNTGATRKCRENGIPYSSFGLLWQVIGKELGFKPESIKKFDYEFIENIDDHLTGDNATKDSISYAIEAMNSNIMDTFEDAVSMMFTMLLAMLDRLREFDDSIEFAKSRFDKTHPAWVDMVDDNICHSCEYFKEVDLPVKVVIKKNVLQVLYSDYCVQNIKRNDNDNVYLFPEEYRGLGKAELDEKFPETGMTFCHPSGNFATFNSYAQAVIWCMKEVTE